jgi:hypothetical protein
MIESTLTQRILKSIRRNPTAPNHKIAKNMGCRVSVVQHARTLLPPTIDVPVIDAPSAPIGVEGVSLTNKNVLPRRPSDSAAKYIRRLPNGRGFRVKDLSKSWGMSEETIRKHARDLGCLKYVEVTADEWVVMVLSPETAAQFK